MTRLGCRPSVGAMVIVGGGGAKGTVCVTAAVTSVVMPATLEAPGAVGRGPGGAVGGNVT